MDKNNYFLSLITSIFPIEGIYIYSDIENLSDRKVDTIPSDDTSLMEETLFLTLSIVNNFRSVIRFKEFI